MIHSGTLASSYVTRSIICNTNNSRAQFKSLSCDEHHSTIISISDVERSVNLCLRKTSQVTKEKETFILQSSGMCKCGRRHFIETFATTLIPSFPALAFGPQSAPSLSSKEMLNKVHPPRPDWYEELYASAMNISMKSYEAEIAGYKSQLFSKLGEQARDILEIGIGTGPNLNYYANGTTDRYVIGVDPNRKMEKYARGAAEAAGLPAENFEFVNAVGESLPVADASVDAVIGTLVLCSVEDVERTLQEVKRVLRPGGLYLFVEHVAAKDGSSLRLVQDILDPLQQLLADGCHLTRETGRYITEAGFSGVDSSATVISSASFLSPHVYGIASK